MFKFIKNNIFIVLILAIGLILAVTNYTPNTFLSGWDSLHPEFNFGLNISRQINGVFRIEQGLGAVAAHSHMADLPHSLILYLLHFTFPQDSLRYLYIFLNLIVGPIGMFLLLNKVIVKNKLASFLGALFYLLNLGTMQIFIVPFEMFTTQYALLPWLFLLATEYIYSNKKPISKLLLFSIATLLATPMAFAATLWYFYFLIFILFVISLNLFDRSPITFKRSSILILTTLAINSFWIIPNIYFVLNHGKDISGALINQLFSPQAFLYNKEFGNVPDIALMKNFLFDWNVYAGGNKFIPLLSPWIEHLKQLPVLMIGYSFAVIAFAGVIFSISKKNKILISLLLPLLICLFFLINDNPPTSFLYNFLQNKIPLFKEAFRFPDDKVLGIFTFVFVLYFAQSQKIILEFINKSFKIKAIYLIFILSLIAYYIFPAFNGNLISPFMRVSIPKDYFKMFDWFKAQDKSARVANLPINTPWGWGYYSWNSSKNSFQGADFLQFGIPQPFLNRDFDRWNPANEQYYREMSEAIYSQDALKLKIVLKKYDISYILLDKSVIAPEQGLNPQILFLKQTEKLLTDSANIQRVFNSGNLSVYKVIDVNKEVRIIKNPVSIEPSSLVAFDDFAYSKYNDYITYTNNTTNTIFYPFRNIMNNENRVSPDLNFLPGQQYRVNLSSNFGNECSSSAPEASKSKMEIMDDPSGKFFRYSSFSGSLCNHYPFPTILRNQGYLISITSRNVSGLPLKLCIENYISKRCDLLTQLSPFSTFTKETFLIPPIGNSIGFNLNINNFAIKGSPAINDISSIIIASFPYSEISKTERYNPITNLNDKSFIVFSQSFDREWNAYEVKNINWLNNTFPSLLGSKVKEHVMVNGWANGWKLSDQNGNNSKIVIFFWPQYLEYVGFAILIGTFMWLFLTFKKK